MTTAVHAVTNGAAPATGPTAEQVRRFEAMLDDPSMRLSYAPPASATPSAFMSHDFTRYASKVSERMRVEMDRPLEIREGASDMDVLRAQFAQNREFMRVNIEFQFATKVAELGTRNVQTLYQMQG